MSERARELTHPRQAPLPGRMPSLPDSQHTVFLPDHGMHSDEWVLFLSPGLRARSHPGKPESPFALLTGGLEQLHRTAVQKGTQSKPETLKIPESS